MGSLSLTCLGTGDGWPSADRGHAAFLYRWEGAAFLVDCGEPVTRSCKAIGLAPDLIDRILISHLHFDHVGGFFLMVQGLWLEGRRRPLITHLPAEGIEPVRRMLDAGYLLPDLLPYRLELAPVDPAVPIVVGPVRVTAFPTTHLDGLRRRLGRVHPQPFAAFSFLFEAPGCRVAHSADIGAVHDLDPLLTQPVDLLVCELAHIDLEQLGALLRTRPVRRVLFMHLARIWQADLDATRRRLAAALGDLPFAIAEEGEVVRVDAATPA